MAVRRRIRVDSRHLRVVAVAGGGADDMQRAGEP